MKRIPESELIIRPDGSIYHLKLKPGDLAEDIITVGDPDRVDLVAQYFENIELTVQTREFKTVTGIQNGKRLSVISTGIGTDNIDIVFNEIDALFNVDFNTRCIKDALTSVRFYRIGTSGALQANIPIDSFLISSFAIGMDGLMEYYQYDPHKELHEIQKKINTNYYISQCDQVLLNRFKSHDFSQGITITAKGFYAPQNRSIRLPIKGENPIKQLKMIQYNGLKVTNLEMETAGIYAMAQLLGHSAISFNAILANRIKGTFSKNAQYTTQKLIKKVLELI